MRARVLALVVTVAAIGPVSACGVAAATSAPATVPRPPATSSVSAVASTATLPARPPGLGPQTLSQVPADAGQVVLVAGAGINSPDASVVLYQRTAAGWQAGATWPAHNALDGWSADHRSGDLRSPIGVFTLTDAGGLLPNPGTTLPYDQSHGFTIGGRGFDNEPLAGSFDYVLAINYNRNAGVSPLDWTRPLGPSRGGGIWFHVDHGGPTHGCVSLPEADMITLLHTLDPAQHPVVVMGDAASLAN
ncbi:MAG TPA: L,D-transpeptidase family protein [Pseudonocardiaceae bacterium]|jgi:L,D-peptidoglycan transpeptidase YkuD (ErfK/YbiS/YcfS/YnhG family)|nr:L,D-transpeptidase family protein [Pseudonocardiaceae bacterium]